MIAQDDVAKLIAEANSLVGRAWATDGLPTKLVAAIEAQQAEIARLQAQYNELIMTVGNKYPGESRHETALKYIRHAEQATDDQAKCNTLTDPKP